MNVTRILRNLTITRYNVTKRNYRVVLRSGTKTCQIHHLGYTRGKGKTTGFATWDQKLAKNITA